jgi:large subunit ribosomal protein L1
MVKKVNPETEDPKEVLKDDKEPSRAEGVEKAKAGKRSAKSVREAEAKEVKEAKKADSSTQKPKADPQKQPRSRAERAGKKYREAVKLIKNEKIYNMEEAVGLAAKSSPTKFDATVELHVNLGVDPKQADQNVRSTVTLPAGTGKQLRVAAFVDDADIGEAEKAGADIAGADKLEEILKKEQADFDVLIATPALMARLSKHARFLGPRGLMPNPKSGTVTTNVTKAITEAKAGKVEYRVDSNGIVHMGIGKVSFGAEKLSDNAREALLSIRAAKPSSQKGIYIKSVHISTTMGPSIKSEMPK